MSGGEITFSVQFKNADELKRKLEAVGVEAATRIKLRAAKESADVVRVEAVTRAPRLTGKLASSIKVRRRKTTDAEGARKIIFEVVAGGDQAWYAHLVEWGFTHTGHGRRRGDRKPTSRGVVSGKAFMRDSAEAKFSEVVETYEKVLSEALDKALAAQTKTFVAG